MKSLQSLQSLQKGTLAHRNVRLFFWATLFGSVNFLEPVMSLFYLGHGLSTAGIYYATLCWCLTVALAEVPTGAFADRFGPKASFLLGCVVNIASKLCLLLLLIGDGSVLWFYAYNVLNGLSATFFSGADEALIYDSLKESGEEDKMDVAIGHVYSSTMYVSIGASLLGAFVVRDLADWQFAILVGAGVALTLVQLLFLVRLQNPAVFEKFRENPYVHVRNGLQHLKNSPRLVRLFVNTTVVFVPTYVVFGKLEQPYLTENGLPVAWLGVVYASVALGGLFLTRNIGRITAKFSRAGLLYGSGAVMAAMLFASAAFPLSPVLAFATFYVLRLLKTLRMPISSHLWNELIPSGSRATTLSLLSIADSMFDLLFLTAFAGIAGLGYAAVFFGCGAAALAGTLIPFHERKSKR